MKPITLRSYRILARKVGDMQCQEPITAKGEEKLRTLEEKLKAYGVPCTGEAHSNAHIDNCMLCAPQWGVMPNPDLVTR